MLLAQVTDTHIKAPGRLAYGRVDTARALEHCVADICRLPVLPDAVVMTGDLTDAGDEAEYELLAALLAPLPMPVLLLPGNHDRREGLRSAFADRGFLPRTGYLNYRVEIGSVRLVALDSLQEGSPHGVLAPETLAFLERELASAPQTPTVVALHHPPFLTGIGFMDACNLNNAEELRVILDRHPQVIQLIAGHAHRSIFGRLGRTPASVAPSPAHLVDLNLAPGAPSGFRLEPPGYHLHRYAEGHLVSHNVHPGPWPGPFPFYEPNGRLID